MKRTVSQKFLQSTYKEFPKLTLKDKKELILLVCTIFNPNRLNNKALLFYEKIGIALLGYELGTNQTTKNRNLNVKVIFESLAVKTNNKFVYSDYNHSEGKAREGWLQDISSEYKQAIIDELTAAYKLEQLIELRTGRKMTPLIEKNNRDDLRLQANALSLTASADVKRLLDYLHSVSIKHFKKVIDSNWRLIVQSIESIECKTIKLHQYSVLAALSENPMPFYQPSKSGNTERIFSLNLSQLNFKREIRKIACRGWTEMDLASSQLAIVATTWNIPLIHAYLKAGKKIWPDLASFMGLDPKNKAIKDLLKDALYSTVYGKTRKNLIEFLKEGLEPFVGKGNTTPYIKLWETHPIISELLKVRSAKMKQLRDAGKTTTIFGKLIDIDARTNQDWANRKTISKKDKYFSYREAIIRSALAEESQAIEFWLLIPVIDLAITSKDFVITIWQFDGFSVKFTKMDRQQATIKKILKAVELRATSINIPTHLEVEVL